MSKQPREEWESAEQLQGVSPLLAGTGLATALPLPTAHVDVRIAKHHQGADLNQGAPAEWRAMQFAVGAHG